MGFSVPPAERAAIPACCADGARRVLYGVLLKEQLQGSPGLSEGSLARTPGLPHFQLVPRGCDAVGPHTWDHILRTTAALMARKIQAAVYLRSCKGKMTFFFFFKLEVLGVGVGGLLKQES